MEKNKEGIIDKIKNLLNKEEKKHTSVGGFNTNKWLFPCASCGCLIQHDGRNDKVCLNCGYLNLATKLPSKPVVSFTHIGYNSQGVLGEEHSGRIEDCKLCREFHNRKFFSKPKVVKQ